MKSSGVCAKGAKMQRTSLKGQAKKALARKTILERALRRLQPTFRERNKRINAINRGA